MADRATIYFDGGAKPNPGEMEVGLVEVVGPLKRPYRQQIGKGTNNVAEWTAILWAMETALSRGYRYLDLIGDSQLVVNQSMGMWKVKSEELRPFKSIFDDLKPRFVYVSVKGVPRARNLAGLMLEGKPF